MKLGRYVIVDDGGNYVTSTSFPGSLIVPPPGGGKMRDPGNEVDVTFHELNDCIKIKK